MKIHLPNLLKSKFQIPWTYIHFNLSDVKSVTRIYIEEAWKKGFERVRIIHGKGIGVQREIVRKLLAETDFVKAFRNGDELSGGGSGATVIQFKASEKSS